MHVPGQPSGDSAWGRRAARLVVWRRLVARRRAWSAAVAPSVHDDRCSRWPGKL